MQIETSAAVTDLEAIASVDGVDEVFIGPADLSASLEHIGNPQHPDVQAAIQDAVRRLRALGKPADILAPRVADARRYIEWGYRFVALGSDLGLLVKGADDLAKSFKQVPLEWGCAGLLGIKVMKFPLGLDRHFGLAPRPGLYQRDGGEPGSFTSPLA